MKVVITGSAGRIGRTAVEALSGEHELVLLDRKSMDDPRSTRADLSETGDWRRRLPFVRTGPARWRRRLRGAECVVHLAGDPSPEAPLESALRHNVRATWNVLEEAESRGVSRVVIASSSRVVLRTVRELAPRCYDPDGPKIGPTAAPAPVGPYGLSKAMMEESGRLFVATGRLPSIIALRIGWFARDPTSGSDPALVHRWIGTDDMASLLRRCVSADVDGFRVAYAVSGQASSPFDRSFARELLGWRPRQSADTGGGHTVAGVGVP